MYLELYITAEYGSRQAFISKLTDEIGANLLATPDALAKSIFCAEAASVGPTVIAAEQIQNKVTVLYFLQGSDTINVHVEAPTVAETKRQADRITRRTRTLFQTPAVKTETKAVIYARNLQGFDTAIIFGNRIGRLRRFVDAFAERWLTRVATPAIVFFLAAAFLRGTSVAQSALFAASAAGIILLIESVLFAVTATDWKWEENKSDG